VFEFLVQLPRTEVDPNLLVAVLGAKNKVELRAAKDIFDENRTT
jgi:hypothetical protein